MGMDVIGRAPTNERGEYFHNNGIWWHPLASYCQEVAPEIARACRYWHTNDGDGLDAAASCAMAEALVAEIISGRCAQAKASLEAAPPRSCPCCEGKGVVCRTGQQTTVQFFGETKFGLPYTTDPFENDDPSSARPCFFCSGKGVVMPSLTTPFSVENVLDFVAFLRDCGGFAIW